MRTFIVSSCALVAALATASCGSRSSPNYTPSSTTGTQNGVLESNGKAKKTSPQDVAKGHSKPVAGVLPSLLSGWAAQQLDSETKRKNHIKLAPAPSTVAAAARAVTGTRTASSGSATALVLYDTAGSWGYLGELYAMATANLASHFGTVTTEPVQSYQSGQVNAFTATIYIGSTYYDLSGDPIPRSFYTDVSTSTHPVIWLCDNIWNFADTIGVAAFETTYGWDPTNSYFAPGGSIGNVQQVTYKSQPLTRIIPAGADGGVVHPYLTPGTGPAVTTLAQAVDSSTSPATTFPWAIRSGNLTYIGEIPFDYVSETNRIIAFEDLLFDALAPATTTRHRAMVRLEDISPGGTDPATLQKIATYLYNAHIPYGFNVIPLYTDPNGYYNNGVPETDTLSGTPALKTVLSYMLAHGGTMIDEGYTHQYASANNPYDGVSGDDAEFFLAHVDSNDYVIWDGPIPNDSTSWATGRLNSAIAAFQAASLPVPKLWVTPHYFATDVDYRAIATKFSARYERSIYFNGLLQGGTVNHASYIGEFFPYPITDVYGAKVLPENLGDYEPVSTNHNPVRVEADIINSATLNLAVRDGIASFFYDPSYGVGSLQTIVQGIQNAGYSFVDPGSL